MQQRPTERDSRFELLRLTAILFVVAHHVLLFGVDACGYLTPYDLQTKGWLGVILNSVFVSGVSLFVMISGWFGIRKVWQPMVRLIVECAAFGAVAFGLSILFHNFWDIKGTDGHWSLLRLWQSVKFTNWWFIVHYLMLILSAPLLERFLDGITQRALEKVLLCLVILNCVFGFWWGYLNPTGYNVLQFIFLYIIARYMRMFPQSHINQLVSKGAWIFLVFSVISIVQNVLCHQPWTPGNAPMAWHYNCPLVIVESIAIFALFARMQLHSPFVNRIARCTLGVYLIQSAPSLVLFRNALGQRLFADYGWLGFVATVVLLFISSLLVSAAVSIPLRKFVWTKIH